MEPQTMKQIAEALRGKQFNTCVDLGCGYGEVAPTLKKHCTHLIGVDKDTTRALISGYDVIYDQLIQTDARTYTLPTNCNLATLCDLVEHISKEDGFELIKKIGNRFCIITTPSQFFPGALNGHMSLWSEQDLKQLGFQTKIYSCGLLRDRVYGKKIIAVR